MDNVTSITRTRQRRKIKEDNQIGIFGLGCGLVLSLIVAFIAIFAIAVYGNITADLPSPELLPALLEPPTGLLLEPTRFYDRSGLHEIFKLTNPAAEKRTYVSIDSDRPIHLPPALITTTLVASDATTWSEQSDPIPAEPDAEYLAVANLLVRDLMLNHETDGWRTTIRQRLLVDQVVTEFGREKLMEWYLNSADYGNLAYGVDAAALVYFGKSASELTLAEAAILAGTAEAPSLNPHDTPDEAQARGRGVLVRALETGQLTTDEFRRAINQRIAIYPPVSGERQPSKTFINLVRTQLEEKIGRDKLVRGGLRIRTTLDYDLQLQVDCTIQVQLARLRGTPENTQAADGVPCEAGRLIQLLDPDEGLKFTDPAGSAVVLNPQTGEVLALVGDTAPGLDPAHLPGRPPGTLLTPYVHLAAYTRGLNPGSLAWDIPSNVPEEVRKTQKNPWNYQGPVRLRTALVNDYLTPTMQLLDQIGPENVWGALPQLGFSSFETPSGDAAYDLLLGGGEITLLDAAYGFSAFSSLGLLSGEPDSGQNSLPPSGGIRPITVLQIEDSNGNIVETGSEVITRPVISQQLAYLITNSLSDESARWETLGHPNLLEVGRPAAAKIGVTPEGQDLWTVGFSPNLVVGVWFGESNPTSDVGDSQGRRSADLPSANVVLGPWHAVMQYASRELPVLAWDQPPGTSVVEVCDPSGMLPTANCPRTINEIFLQGNEPTQPDTLYRNYQVNRETGRLATVFTPAELIEDKVYMVVPPEAAEWANEVEINTPPDAYDLIFSPAAALQGVSLQSPEMFAYVRGKIPVIGSAGGSGFSYYRLQAGQGLNPQSWIQLGENVPRTVSDDLLGIWDASELSGLYALQLLVVREDQRVDKITIQVTVDNTPPEVLILNPAEGQEHSNSASSTLILQIEASDDLAVDRVEYFIDGKKLATVLEPPYTLPATLQPGEHTLLVTAYDKAGNHSESQTRFNVIQ